LDGGDGMVEFGGGIGSVGAIGMEVVDDGISNGEIGSVGGDGGMSNVVGGNWVTVGCGCDGG